MQSPLKMILFEARLCTFQTNDRPHWRQQTRPSLRDLGCRPTKPRHWYWGNCSEPGMMSNFRARKSLKFLFGHANCIWIEFGSKNLLNLCCCMILDGSKPRFSCISLPRRHNTRWRSPAQFGSKLCQLSRLLGRAFTLALTSNSPVLVGYLTMRGVGMMVMIRCWRQLKTIKQWPKLVGGLEHVLFKKKMG